MINVMSNSRQSPRWIIVSIVCCVLALTASSVSGSFYIFHYRRLILYLAAACGTIIGVLTTAQLITTRGRYLYIDIPALALSLAPVAHLFWLEYSLSHKG